MSELDVTAGWRRGEDSVYPQNITPAAQVVMGYPQLGWTDADFARFERQGKAVARIAQRDPVDWVQCSIFDYEARAITPDRLRSSVIARNGYRPDSATVYASIGAAPLGSTWRYIGKLLAGLEYWACVAWWPNYPTVQEVQLVESLLPAGARLAAIQYVDAGPVDLSVVLAPDWHPQP